MQLIYAILHILKLQISEIVFYLYLFQNVLKNIDCENKKK